MITEDHMREARKKLYGLNAPILDVIDLAHYGKIELDRHDTDILYGVMERIRNMHILTGKKIDPLIAKILEGGPAHGR